MRPALHYAPPGHWVNDPTGLVPAGTGYRVFFQYADDPPAYTRVHWGTAWSPDLVTWLASGTALAATEVVSAYSGSVISVGSPPPSPTIPSRLLAFYTAHRRVPPRRQAVCIATSDDGGQSFAAHPENPVLDEGLANFRDPFVRPSPAGGFTMLVAQPCDWDEPTSSSASRLRLYTSHDLLAWSPAGTIGPWHEPGVLWEVPWLVPLSAPDGDPHWLLGISLVDRRGPTPRAAVHGWLGRFAGEAFVPHDGEPVGGRLLDFGPDFYAATPADVPTPAGTAAVIAWVGNWAYARSLPLGSFHGGPLSWPRTLALARGPSGRPEVTSRPAIDLGPRRGRASEMRLHARDGSPVRVALDAIEGACELDLEIVLEGAESADLGLWDGELALGLAAAGTELVLERRRLEPHVPGFDGAWRRVRARPSSRVRVLLWIDGCVAESCWDDGAAMATALVLPRQRTGQVTFAAVGGPATCVVRSRRIVTG